MEPDNALGVIGVEHDPEYLIVDSEGGVRSHFNVVLTPEKVGRIRAGYDCAKCLERHEEAWPAKCQACGFPISDRQAEFVAKEYRGTVRVGSSDSEDAQLAALEEARFNEDVARRGKIQVVKPQIIVPRDLN